MYQQMLAFLAILMTMIVIVGFLFAQFMFHSVYEQTYKSLDNYATTFFSLIVNKEATDDEQKLAIDQTVFQTARKIMSDQDIKISVYDNQKHIRVYGIDGPKQISESFWEDVFVGDSRIKRTQAGDQLSVYRGWMYDGKKLAVVRVSSKVVGKKAQTTMLLQEMVVAMVIGGTLAMSLAAVISWRWSHIITEMQQATEQMAEGDYELKLKRTGKDELGKLASDINHLSVALQAQSDEIMEQEERRKQFMANASHEMRTPLTTMSGLLEGLEYDVFPEEEKARAYALMQKETKRLIRLVEDNLDYEKLRANKIVLRKQKLDAYKLVTDLSNQLANKAAQEETTIEVLGDSGTTVYGDQDRLTQVLFNLINNAIQFTQKGKITLTVSRQDHATRFTVSDTGIGMTAEQVDKVFERYYKADPSRMTTKGESGIGMAIVKQIVTLHDGDIMIDSTPDVGTTITVIIPDRQA
jgi:signal transduction histidine kinase